MKVHDQSDDFSKEVVSGSLEDKRSFHEQLYSAEPDAIRQLHARIAGSIANAASYRQIGPQDTEEIIQDALLITIKKIRDGSFRFLGFDPATYAVQVGRGLLLNLCRKRKIPHDNLESQHNLVDADAHLFVEKKEQLELLEQAIKRLGEGCRQLLRYRFYENLTDEAVLLLGTTPYANTDSLKVTRNRCMKKLAAFLMPLRSELLG
ncbi:MAG TPA: sigma-70 family RNA polymerase sigma factor [Saprospiraceae bacterium]|nr:sigma-70 family RNA polymerase sigma factor [Saprospiraceae bacterium]